MNIISLKFLVYFFSSWQLLSQPYTSETLITCTCFLMLSCLATWIKFFCCDKGSWWKVLCACCFHISHASITWHDTYQLVCMPCFHTCMTLHTIFLRAGSRCIMVTTMVNPHHIAWVQIHYWFKSFLVSRFCGNIWYCHAAISHLSLLMSSISECCELYNTLIIDYSGSS